MRPGTSSMIKDLAACFTGLGRARSSPASSSSRCLEGACLLGLHSGRAARSVPLLCRSLKIAGRDGAFAAQPGKPCSDLLPLDGHRVRTKEQGEMAACRCGQADLFARGPDQVEGTEELFGRCNLVRLTGEKVQRNPDRLEVRQAAERFKAARCQLVLAKELPDNVEVKGAREIHSPPVPGPEPFEHLLRQIDLEDLGNS